MRRIVKRLEPRSLIEYRRTANPNYDDYRDKDSLRQSLVGEQRGLCCYCLSPIRPEIGVMRVEHWHCQDNYPGEQLVMRTCWPHVWATKDSPGNWSIATSGKEMTTSRETPQTRPAKSRSLSGTKVTAQLFPITKPLIENSTTF